MACVMATLQLAPSSASFLRHINVHKGSMNIIMGTHRKWLKSTVANQVVIGVMDVKSNGVDGYVILEPERERVLRRGGRDGEGR